VTALTKATLIAVLLGGTLGFGAGAAYASGNVQSQVGQFSLYGRTYQTLAALDPTANGGDGNAASFIYAQGGTVPTGWMYARGRAFIGGNFCDEGWAVYNNIPAYEVSNGVWLSCGYGAYQSYGVVGAWNGNGYNYYYTFWTPVAYGGN
jgi:hypothetical protein